MSGQYQEPGARRGFTIVANTIIDDPTLSGGAKMLYLILARHSSRDGVSWPGEERIRLLSGLGREKLGQVRSELEARGLLKVTRRGAMQTNLYEVRLLHEGPIPEPVNHEVLKTDNHPGSEGSDCLETDNHEPSFSHNHDRPETDNEQDPGEQDPIEQPVSPISVALSGLKSSLPLQSVAPLPPAAASKSRAQNVKKLLTKLMSEGAQRVVDDWCEKQGRQTTLNPEQVRLLESTLEKVGIDLLLEANSWAAAEGIGSFEKARRAALTMSKKATNGGAHATTGREPERPRTRVSGSRQPGPNPPAWMREYFPDILAAGAQDPDHPGTD